MYNYLDFLLDPEEEEAADCGADLSDPCFFFGAFFGFLSPISFTTFNYI